MRVVASALSRRLFEPYPSRSGPMRYASAEENAATSKARRARRVRAQPGGRRGVFCCDSGAWGRGSGDSAVCECVMPRRYEPARSGLA